MISNTRRTTALAAIAEYNLMRLIVSNCYDRFKGESVFGYRFNDENLSKQFTHRGQVAMANNGKDTNGEGFSSPVIHGLTSFLIVSIHLNAHSTGSDCLLDMYSPCRLTVFHYI